MNFRPLLTLLFLLSSVTATAGDGDFDRLLDRFRAAATFDVTYPRELVTLHLDNNAYVEGETLWFKAYVVRASSLRQAPLSRVLYVDLLNDGGHVLDHKLVRLDSLGTGTGEFPLVAPIHSGFHEIRAYTREMLNWGTEACFSMVVPVFRTEAEKHDETANLIIDRPERETDLMTGHPRPFFFGGKNRPVLQLFPEGGHRVGGMEERFAFRLTGNDGTPLTDSLYIVTDDGRTAAVTAPEVDGMGLFTLPADVRTARVHIGSPASSRSVPLPEPDSAARIVLRADPVAEGALLRINHGEDTSRIVGMAVTCRDRVCYFDTLTLVPGITELLLPDEVMHDGVNRIDLFDTAGYSLVSRSVWKDSGGRDLRLTVEQSADSFAPCTPIALKFHLTDAAGRPVRGSFSLSVRDADGELSGTQQPGTDARLLLRAGTDGYIDRPEQYLSRSDDAHRRAIDLLLLTRAWHANTFSTLCGTDTFRLTQPIEESLTLNGQVLRDNDRRIPLADHTLRLFMMSKAGASLSAEAVTDSAGRFAFTSNVDYVGDWLAQFIVKNDDGNRRRSRITIDRWFAPDVRPFDSRQLIVTPPLRPEALHPATFAWQDTIPNTVPTRLGEAVVTTRRKYRGLTGNRYTYMGGEQAGIEIADIYYNIHRERERLLDRGIYVESLGQVLASLNDKFEYTTLDDDNRAGTAKQDGIEPATTEGDTPPDYATPREEIKYGANRLTTFVNNDPEGDRLQPVDVNEVKSVVITRNNRWRRFLKVQSSDFSPNEAMYIYTDPEAYMFRSRRGVEKRHLTGYSIPARFSMPDYRHDLPANADDLRRTLLWQPEVTTDEKGCATVIVYSNARPDQHIRITARGITPDGRLIHLDQ